ncbi:MAG: hypothetical protein JO104_00235, partial [Candidatus Eremiobacteraeota bacterium]|nr:hypothetical protein [Candidatus Eremiobacteraeota bacterium]
RIYHPGQLLEFSDVPYPVRPDLTVAGWTSWWTNSVFLGFLWANTALLPHVAIPRMAQGLHVAPGLGQAFQYFVVIAIPVVGVANCIAGLAASRLRWTASLPLVLLPFNLYVALVWPSFIAGYAFGSAALLAWGLVEGIERRRWATGLLVCALGSLWLSTDAANPPYFLIAVAHTCVFALWLIIRNRDARTRSLRFCAAVLAVALLIGARWIVPFVVGYTHYPLAHFATANVEAFGFVSARAHLINALRLTPMWYWGSGADFSYYSHGYEQNAALVLGTFVPFAFVLAGLCLAIARRRRSLIALIALSFVWMFLVKGENIPFVGFSHFVYNLPLMSLFRDTEKFVGPFLIDATIATGLAFCSIELPALSAALLSGTAAFGALAGGWLMIGGELFTSPHGVPPLYVRVPEPYLNLDARVRSLGIARTALSPPDTFYEVSTNWGFFGADAQFFNDLPDVPLFYPTPLTYTEHKNFDSLWSTYWDNASGDATARSVLETRVSVDGVIVRDDLVPYLGIEPWMWRAGDLRSDFPKRVADDEFTIYAKGRSAPYAYEVPFALIAKSENYEPDFRDLLALGLTSPPLVDGGGRTDLPHTEAVAAVGSSAAASAFLVHGGERGTFVATPGRYDAIARASRSAAFRRNLAQPTGLQPHAAPEIVFGITANFVKAPAQADPLGETYGFQTEGAYAAAVRLKLPTLGPHEPTCADVKINGTTVGNVRVRPGRQTLLVPAVVPPGNFEAELAFGVPGTCVDASSDEIPIWTTSAAPPSVVGAPVHAAGAFETFLRSYALAMPLSEYPSVHFRRWEPLAPSDTEDTFVLAHVRGAGCDAVVSAREAQNVVTRFDDVGRRPLLSPACRDAALDRLSIVRVDVVVAGKPGSLRPPRSLLVQPARAARSWDIFPTGAFRRLPGGVTAWSWSGISVPLGLAPEIKITAEQRCFPWLRLRARFTNAPMNGVDVGDLRPYSIPPFAAGDGHAVVRLEDVARQFQLPDAAALTGIDLYGIAPSALARTCRVSAAAVSSDAGAGPAVMAIDGRRLDVPRDDRPHRYSIVLRGGRHEIELGNAMETGALFRSGIIAPWKIVPADLQRIETNLDQPGWVVYSQAADSLWHGALSGVPLPQYRADLDLQAYDVPAPGHLNVTLPIARLQPFAEATTWVTLAILALWAGVRWRRA